jgi:DNA-binding MarR family transcriptional regulator
MQRFKEVWSVAQREIQFVREMFQLLVRRFGLLQKEGAQCCGISLAQSHVLYELARRPEMTLNELAGGLGLDKSTVSRHVQGLVRGGYVVRRPSEEDRRYVILRLTPAGREKQREITAQMAGFIQDIIGHVPEQKRSEVIESMALLARAMRAGARSARTCCRHPGVPPFTSPPVQFGLGRIVDQGQNQY